MRAIVCREYGPAEVLRLEDVEKPSPKDDELLIRIHATSVNSGEVRLRKPDPFAVRFMFGLFRPKFPILGIVVAGVVESIGKRVTKFKAGDEIFGSAGMTFGAYAEYICLCENAALAPKPANITFEEAAAIPFGGTTALSFLRKGNIHSGQRVLIYGASGAIGTIAVQLVKHFGADVSAVCGPTNVEMVRSLGANKMFDYTTQNFSESGDTYDIILDTVGKSPFTACVRSLENNGIYLRIVHMDPVAIVRGIWTSLTTAKKVIGGGITETAEDMAFLGKLVETGEIKPVIDRTYPLAQIPAAHAYVELGHKKGNVVITI